MRSFSGDKYGTEMVEMLFKELTREEDLEISRLDGYDEGFANGENAGFTKGESVGLAKGEKRGAAQKEREIAKGMLREGMAKELIAKLTGLTLKEVAEL